MGEKKATRVFQKYLNAIATCDEKEIRLAKRFKDAARTFEKWEQIKLEKTALLKDSIKNKKTNETIVADLKEIKCNQEIEMIRLRQQLKTLMRKSAAQESCLNGDNFIIYGMDREIAYKKRLLLCALKAASNMYLGETNPAGSIAGFFCDETEPDIIPFEIEQNKFSSVEITDQLFELMKQTSPYSEKWEDIFLE